MSKITAEHLARTAYVYIRQSTADQLVQSGKPAVDDLHAVQPSWRARSASPYCRRAQTFEARPARAAARATQTANPAQQPFDFQ
jgi:hypothetical protein